MGEHCLLLLCCSPGYCIGVYQEKLVPQSFKFDLGFNGGRTDGGIGAAVGTMATACSSAEL